MAKAEFALQTIAKSALLWLTAGVLFASVFGALLSATASRPSIRFAESSPEPVVADAGAK
jgi:hypothetical protein